MPRIVQPRFNLIKEWCSSGSAVYNFVKIHGAIKITPEMEAGVTDLLWSMEDIEVIAEKND
jgi:hypothetical protein